MTEVERKKCNRCKVNMTFDKFKKKRDDSYQKICIECNSKCVKIANENKCEHNLQKARCRDCGGSHFCEHSIQKTQCRKCSNNQFCDHNRLKSTCKDCGDPIKITIKNWINQSKVSDKKNNRFDIVNFIDKCFCENLIEEYPNCYYCSVELQYKNYQDDLATIERIDNKLGHIKSNCVIACKTCNVSKVGGN